MCAGVPSNKLRNLEAKVSGEVWRDVKGPRDNVIVLHVTARRLTATRIKL